MVCSYVFLDHRGHKTSSFPDILVELQPYQKRILSWPCDRVTLRERGTFSFTSIFCTVFESLF